MSNSTGLPCCSSNTPACNCRVILKSLIRWFRCLEQNLQQDGLSGEEFEITASTERQYSIWRQKGREKKGGKPNWSAILLMAATEDKRGYLVEIHAQCWVMHSCFWHPNCHLVLALISLGLSSWVISPALHHFQKDPHHTERNLQAAFPHPFPSWLKAICESDLSCAKMLSGSDFARKWNPLLPDHERIMNNRPFVW